MFRSIRRQVFQLKKDMERLKPSYNQVIDALQDFIWYRNLDKLMAKVEEITLAVPAVEFRCV